MQYDTKSYRVCVSVETVSLIDRDDNDSGQCARQLTNNDWITDCTTVAG